MKKSAIMVVMNTLHTDARVQRAATSLQELFDLTVVGVGKDCGEQEYKQVLLEIKAKNGIARYFEYIRKVKRLLKDSKYDLLYAHDYFSAAIVPWAKKKYPNMISVYDSHELIFSAEGYSVSMRDHFFCHNEKKAIRHADLVICATQERGALMQQQYNLDKIPLVIENISQLPLISDENSDLIITETESFFNKDKCILVYAGVVTAGRRIDRLIDIVSTRHDTALLVIGAGNDEERLKRLAEEKIPGRYLFTGSLPYKYLGVLLKKCDVGYISYPTNSLNNIYCAPNKIYEYASVELPMIAPENPTVRQFFDENGIGVINSDLGVAFDSVRSQIGVYKENCIKFTKSHQWNDKSKILRNTIEQLL